MVYDTSDFMPHSKFYTEADMLLKEFAKHYHYGDRAGSHSDVRAQATSSRITEFVFNHWREEYRDLNLPTYHRKHWLPYKQEGNN